MSIEPFCICGHRRNEHESVVAFKDEDGVAIQWSRCSFAGCKCEMYGRRPVATWIKIARMAEHARRVDGVRAIVTRPGDERNLWAALVAMPPGFDLERLDDDHGEEELQLCEMLGSMLLERAHEIHGVEGRRRIEQLDRNCATCGALIEHACRPMHEGERAAGGWCHPARRDFDVELDVDSVLMQRAVSWAFEATSVDETYIPPPLSVGKLAAAIRRMERALCEDAAEIQRLRFALRNADQRADTFARDLQNERTRARGNAVGAARQSCTICYGTGIDSGQSTPASPRPCSCAAGGAVDTRTGRMQDRPRPDSFAQRIARAQPAPPSFGSRLGRIAGTRTGAEVLARNEEEHLRVEQQGEDDE